MKQILSYIKFHKKSILLFALWILIFLTVFWLSDLPFDAVGYAVLLFVVLGGILVILDYREFCRRQKQRMEAKKNIALTLERLPVPENPVEESYQELIDILFDGKCELKSSFDNQYSEMLEYYTMWVHQIKTPIAAMRLLLQSGEEEEQKELSEQLFKIEEYVEMVLQYLRMGDMGADLKIQTYSLDDIIKQALRKYSKSFIRKRIRLEYQPLMCTVITDEKWLLFVIEQLLSNALKYTRTGTISIYMEETEKKTLVIRDTGIGIAGEDLPRIFEKGFTGYNGRTDKKSTGIGLYLCKNIMDKMNHGLQIESEAGVGTRVKCNLESAKLEID